MSKSFFKQFVTVSPFSLALWRTLEAEAINTNYPETLMKSPVLDLGCGFGEFSKIFFDKKVDVGIDINATDIQRAKKSGIYKKAVIGDARSMPFPNASFRTIFSLGVLEHIPHTQKAIQESYRVLKPGGVLVFTVPTKDIEGLLFFTEILRLFSLEFLAKKYITFFHYIFKHQVIVNPDTWKKWVKDAGFTSVKIYSTATVKAVGYFDALLLFGLPSFISRYITGTRFVYHYRLRMQLLSKLYDSIKKSPPCNANILIVAQK